MRSLRTRLIALWLMLAASAAATGFVLFTFYRQSANAQIARGEETVARSCRDVSDRYSFVMAGWTGSTQSIDESLKQRLVQAVQTALARAPGVEGGIWQAVTGSLAYAFPTYEGTGPKTDLPEAELASIRQVNDDAARNERPATMRRTAGSQVILFHAYPNEGLLPDVTGWTMTRVFIGQSPAYHQLLIGSTVLAATVLGSAIWLAVILLAWSRKIARLQVMLGVDPKHDLQPRYLPRPSQQDDCEPYRRAEHRRRKDRRSDQKLMIGGALSDEDPGHGPARDIGQQPLVRIGVKKDHLRSSRPPHGGRALVASGVVVDLADARKLRLRQIGLRSGPFVGGKGIGERTRRRLPNSTLDPGRPRERSLHGLNESLLQ